MSLDLAFANKKLLSKHRKKTKPDFSDCTSPRKKSSSLNALKTLPHRATDPAFPNCDLSQQLSLILLSTIII